MKYLFILIYCVGALFANAQNGTLDSSFGTNGILFDERFRVYSSDMLIQEDGKIVLAGGNFTLSRYNPNGSFDSTFGVNGFTNYIINTQCVAVALQQNDKIIAAGILSITDSHSSSVILVRYLSDGTIDSSFGSNGIVTKSIQRYDNVSNLAVQQDGKIVVIGKAVNDPGGKPDEIFCIRFNENGTTDRNFANNGVFIKSADDGFYSANGLLVDQIGNIFLGISVV